MARSLAPAGHSTNPLGFLALWAALEYIEAVVPAADQTVDKIARLVDRQLLFFLIEIGVLGLTLIAALLA